MSEFDVYGSEMAKSELTDQDAERILSGSEPEDVTLARLTAALAALHRVEAAALSEDQADQLVARAVALSQNARPGSAQPDGNSQDGATKRALRTLRHRLAVLAATIFVVSGMTGVAVASDEAAPGDELYGIDRALERVGIGVGGAAERITEAQVLANAGQVTAAINHVAEAIEESEVDDQSDEFSPEASGAAAALRSAAENVKGDDDPESQNVRDAVAAMLDEMADMTGDPEFDGEAFGRRISELARSIGDPAAEAPGLDDQTGRSDRAGGEDDAGRPSQVPGGPPDDTPGGPPGGAGRP